jgi:hypothetical protein
MFRTAETTASGAGELNQKKKVSSKVLVNLSSIQTLSKLRGYFPNRTTAASHSETVKPHQCQRSHLPDNRACHRFEKTSQENRDVQHTRFIRDSRKFPIRW